MTTAFLGLGRMGVLMAGHLLDTGHDLVVWNRSPSKASGLAQRGARVAPSVADAVAGADRVAPMLFGPDSVREVLADVVEAKDLDLTVTSADGDLPVTAACLDAARGALSDHAGQDYAAVTAHIAER